jgi:integrase
LAPGEGTAVIFDSEVPGLGVRLYPGGAKSFVFDYRLRGRQRRPVLGKVGVWTLEAARMHARTLRVELDKGIDPFGKQGSLAPQWTVRDAWGRYERDYAPALAPRSASDIRSMWEAYILPKVGACRLEELEFSHVEQVHRSVGAPYRANRVYETFRRILNLCVKWGWIDRNPAIGLEVNRETPRNAYLTADQVRAVLAGLPHSESGDAIRMLLLTGARLGEVLGMRWDQVDLAAGVWTKPAASTKQRREHRMPLPPAAVEIVRGRPRIGDLVFSRPDGGPIRDLRKTWSWACKRAGVPRLRIHDCRHTVASLLVSNGATLAVVGAILGHANPSVTNRYAHLLDDPLRRALAGVADQVAPQ